MAKLIVGLGNPGEKYELTRHNLGFRVIDKIAADFDFPELKLASKFKAEMLEKTIDREKIILAKPQTFMNDSGKAVVQISQFYKIEPENILVIHDELDLPLGKLRISFDKSSGGHKGVQSIIDQLGRKDFFRFRIGIGQAEKIDEKDFVLGKFLEEEKEIIEKAIEKSALAVKTALGEGIKKTISKSNSK
jgi:PTH1 family peptidyl-tRNA hydrolase